MSAADCMGCSVGAGVAAAGSTAKDVIACDGQYDSEPANDAYTEYCPTMSGVQFSVKKPSFVIGEPISR